MSKEKLDELFSLKLKIQSKEFQDYIMKPLYAELDKLKVAYDCKTLTELSTLKGKKEGLMKIIDILKDIEVEIKNLKDELEDSD